MSQASLLALLLVTLPIIGYLLLLAIARRRESSWRVALTHTTAAWGVTVVLLSELLSRPHCLSRRGLAMAWLTVDLALAIIAWRLPQRAASLSVATVTAAEDNLVPESLRGWDKVFLAGAGLIMLLTAITALIAPPNQGDVMSYHLPRIVFWLQNRSVEFFPTDDGRQLHQPPGAEYAVMQFHALFGGDRFDGMIQWFGYALSAVIASLVAQRMGAGRRAQILAAVFCLTMPHSITQATNGKNDCVVACLLAALVYYLLAFKDAPSLGKMLGIGASLGLALLAKGTAYFFAPPLLLALALTWPKKSWLKALRYAPAGIALALTLNAGQWTRNYQLSGSPVGPDNEWGARFGNDRITPAIIFASILKNCALHTRTPSEKINALIQSGVTKAASFAGVDVNDLTTNWGGATFGIPNRSSGESYSVNTWHFLLILITLALMIFSRQSRRQSLTWAYALGLLIGFVFFCAVLRWQLGGARFQIPLLVLWSVPVATMLARAPAVVAITTTASLLLLALPWAVDTPRRSMLPNNEYCIFKRSRLELYLAYRPELLEAYIAAADAVRKTGCRQIGIISDLDLAEYPLLVLLGAEKGDGAVRHVALLHASKTYSQREPAFAPCAIVCPQCGNLRLEQYAGRFDSEMRFPKVTVLTSKSGFSR